MQNSPGAVNFIVSKSENERRLELCRGCEHHRKIVGLDQCKKCGCVMQIKARFLVATCPIGKWGPGYGDERAAEEKV